MFDNSTVYKTNLICELPAFSFEKNKKKVQIQYMDFGLNLCNLSFPEKGIF